MARKTQTQKHRMRNRNPDRVTANQVDTVAYYETSACESLDDEIENDALPMISSPSTWVQLNP